MRTQKEFHSGIRIAVFVMLLLGFVICSVRAQEDEDHQWGMWTGLLWRFPQAKAPDLSIEYQVRLDDNLRSLKSHFFEGLGYIKPTKNLELAGGYRWTFRPDHNEHRLMLLGWWDMRVLRGHSKKATAGFVINHHAGYQRDFNLKITDRLIQSNSVRYLLTVHKELSKSTAVFVRGGALFTWNEEFSFGVDRLRFIVGIRVFRNETDRILVQYMWERNRSVDPWKHSNVIWIRYLIVLR